METIVYYYKIPGTGAPEIEAPAGWQVVGPFADGSNWDNFNKPEFVEDLDGGEWPGKLRGMKVATIETDRGWFDLHNVFFARQHPHTPHALLDHSAYARTTLESRLPREAVLRFTTDDWCTVWLNGEKVATIRHEIGLETVRLPVSLRQGANELLVKTNNTEGPANKRLWVINCVVEDKQRSPGT